MKTVGYRIAMTCTLALLLGGCGPSEKAASPGERPADPAAPATAPQPATLAGTAWLVEDIAERGIIDRSHVFIRFDPTGRVSGSTGCNNFTGAATIAGENLTFGPMASTRRAGPEAIMDQEQRFLAALGATATWTIDEHGLLRLRGSAGERLLRLSPMPPEKAAPATDAAP